MNMYVSCDHSIVLDWQTSQYHRGHSKIHIKLSEAQASTKTLEYTSLILNILLFTIEQMPTTISPLLNGLGQYTKIQAIFNKFKKIIL